jgi:hypothetical protein
MTCDATSWSVTLKSSITLLESSYMLLDDIHSIYFTYDCQLRSSLTIITYDHHLWYDRHLWSSLTIVTYNHHLRSSLMIVTYDSHLWSSLTIITYNHHLWSSLRIITYDDHLRSSLTIVICYHNMFIVQATGSPRYAPALLAIIRLGTNTLAYCKHS